ncbi:SDR family NAD(P)-dependent oxidoreductase [Nostoc sp. NMS4]|uniref:SDR family NAD(P)-dependent oxidoreductase n=1 Tax=Nostoc sp. NMS4 TaxID=2815390 RepID=UPI0025CDF61A|nr:SDR family NAD(P)-dependent oxidoreductase [Nostoc sp. NMS4]MBN3925717.1 SDR family NAD(P)-dependent oxidoreductase [Nostoc sp. NMS4]
MNLNQLIAELSVAGIKLTADGDQLRVRAAKGVLTPQIRDSIAKQKTELLKLLRDENKGTSDTNLPLVKVSREQNLPLSFPQQQMWFFDQLQPNNPFYNLQLCLALHGSVNTVALLQSVNEIIRRHEVLRTTFTQVDGRSVQIIASKLNITMPVVDLRHLPDGERKIEAQRISTKEAQHCFDLATVPLLRVLLIHLEAAEYLLVVTTHHIIFDGWSMGVFIRELAANYQAFCTNKPSPLPELPVQYADFASWQRQWLQKETEKTLLTYWKQQLQGAPPLLKLPLDHPRPPAQSFRGAKQFIELPKSLSEALKNLSQQQGVSLFMTLLTAFKVLLCCYTSQQDIVVGSAIANRNQTEVEGLIGFFANALVLRTDLSGNPTFRELLLRVQKVALEAYAHQDLPFERLVKELEPERSLSYNPLYQVIFALQNKPDTLAVSNLTFNFVEAFNEQATRLDLECHLCETPEGIRGFLIYSTDLFEQATITRMAGHFQTLLSGIVANPHQKLSQLPLFSAAQRHQMLVEWNKTPADDPQHLCIHQLIEAQSLKTPDAVAVVFEDKQLTYSQLNSKANKIGHYLQTLGVSPEKIVGIYVERSLEMVIGILGILKAGAAYLPLDSNDTPERLQMMLAETQPLVLLSQQLLIERLPNQQAQVICLDSDWQVITQHSDENLESKVTSENLAYIIYSSKCGVLVEHCGVIERLDWLQKTFVLSESDALLHKAPLTQDTAVWEIFWSLIHGGRLVIAATQGEDNPEYLQRVIAEQKISLIHFVPYVLFAFVESLSQDAAPSLSSLRSVLCSGEPLHNQVIETFFQHFRCELYNLCSLPEAATELTAQVYNYTHTSNKLLINYVKNNLSMYVLNKYMQLVPIGVTGEIYVSAKKLFRGYLNHREEIVQRFVNHPFYEELNNGQLLKTGYLGRYLNDGKLEILGASDRQVWINNFRIDLNEVETTILQNISVNDCVVLARSTETFRQELVAYVVLSGPFSPEQLQLQLQAVLPFDSQLCTFIPVTKLPLTATGQLDEQALTSLEVIDSNLIQRWEKSLRSLHEVKEVAVAVHKQIEFLPPLHLSDILPESKTISLRQVNQSSAKSSSTTVQDRPVVKQLAISDGGALQLPPDAASTLPEALKRAALQAPDKGIVYLKTDGSEIFRSYQALLEESEKILAGLRRLGLKAKDQVILQLNCNEDFISAFWGCILGGFIPVPISVPTSYEEDHSTFNKLHNTWQMLGKPIVVTSKQLIASVRSRAQLLNLENFQVETIDELRCCEPDQNWHISQPEDVTLLMLTSGSTGMPKGVMLSHYNLLSRTAGSIQMNGFSSSDVTLNWMSLDHVAGIIYFHIRDVYLGCQQIQVPTQLILQEPLKWLDWIEQYGVTITFAPNFAFGLVNNHASEIKLRRWDLSCLKFVLNGAESVVAKTARRFLEILAPHGLSATSIHPAWGMAEVSSGVTYSNHFSLLSTNDDDSFVNVGKPIPGVSLRIVDSHNQIVYEDTIGSLQVRGSTVMLGYYNNDELNREVFTEDGWFKTGDLAFIHQGYLTITGREKDVIIINGQNYYSHEIEAAVEELSGVEVSFTAAVGVRDAFDNTDKLAIFFSSAIGDEAEVVNLTQEIRNQVVQKIGINPSYLIPVEKQIIPKTAIGKIQRSQLKQRFEADEFKDILKRLDILSGNANTLPDWFYSKIWRPKEVVSSQRLLRVGQSLVFLDSLGLSTYLCTELSQLNPDCVRVEAGADFAKLNSNYYRINPKEPSHYLQLLKSLLKDGLQIDLILHLWAYDNYAGEISSLDQLEQAQYQGTYSLLFLIQALAQVQKDIPTQLYVIASHTQATSPSDKIAYEKTPVLGLIKTISQENPWLKCRHIDLPIDLVEVNATRILQEMRVMQSEKEVAYRNGHRLIPRLSKINLSQEKKQEIPLKQGGMYLLTGGLGGIGVEIAKYLLTHYQVRLLLVGRTAIPQRNLWETHLQKTDDSISQSIRTLLTLEQLEGDILYQAVDVCDFAQLQQVVEQAKSHWKCELDGVIHLAGIFHARLLLEETYDEFAAVLRPKVLGTWALHQIVKQRPDRIFISFSSVNGFFGGTTVGAYAAANNFLDSFSYYQRHQNSLHSYCFAWSGWDEVGMSRNNKNKELSHARGYSTLTIEQGLYSLLAGLHHNQAHLFVGLDGSNQYIREYTEDTSFRIQKLLGYYTSKVESTAIAKLEELVVCDRFQTQSDCQFLQLPEMPLTADGKIDYSNLPVPTWASSRRNKDFVVARDALETQLAQIWEKLLDVRPIGITDNFFSLGGNSILVLRLTAEIHKSFDKEIAVSTIFQEATIEHLADILRQESNFLPKSPLVPIQPLGSNPPFFCVYPASGNILSYLDLASYLGSNQPFYGLEPLGLDKELTLYYGIENLATHYIKALRVVQPQGPYYIGGWCLGGIVALEMAQQMQKQGLEVALLAMLDSPMAIPVDKTVDDDLNAKAFIRLAKYIEIFHQQKLAVSYEELQKLELQEQVSYMVEKIKQSNFWLAEMKVEQIHDILDISKNSIQSFRSYIPQIYPDKITFFRASEMLPEDFRDTELDRDDMAAGWEKISLKPIEIIDVPGNHLTMFNKPHVQVLAEQLSNFIRGCGSNR